MKNVGKYILLILVLSLFSANAWSVTKEEMEQARAIAAQVYLRYTNNGSDYLDALTPKTMSELESKLKGKELENIKAFKAVTTATDYADWDKDKLVRYWSETFFSAPGLSKESESARNAVIRKKISAMEIKKTEQKPAEEALPAEEKKQEEVIASMPDDSVSASYEEKMQEVLEAEKSLEQVEPSKKSDSGTWIYVVILIILVGLVLWLVIFASKTMSKSEKNDNSAPLKDNSEELEAMESKFNSALLAKNNELRALSAKFEKTIDDNNKLRLKNQMLQKEKEHLMSRIAEMEEMLTGERVSQNRESKRETLSPRDGRVIYVGRVNSKGIFMRADREFNAANDVYRLVTADGKTGRFEVVEDPDLDEMILLSPQSMLANGCKGIDFSQIHPGDRVVTVSPGEAVFENGYWKVARKAIIEID